MSEIEIDYEITGGLLEVRTELGGAKISLTIDYAQEGAAEAADTLLASASPIIAAVLKDAGITTEQEESSD